ncbi:MAG: NAD kinase, partial [Bacteroidota bacterium]|nr:NAD kinase [Bacteroidota bacterium]
DFYDEIFKIFKKLNDNNIEIFIYKKFYDFISKKLSFSPKVTGYYDKNSGLDKEFDVFFSIGGDGTFIECASLLKKRNIPIIGINSGRLGFLASISKNEISSAIDEILKKKFTLEKRGLLEIKIDSETNFFKDFPYAINELTILKKETASMINIEVFVNKQFLNTYWADGLIISTPTGSTAYSLSAGGPIILPGSNNFVITPLAPHTLTVRPIVVPDDVELKIIVHGRGDKFLTTIDSYNALIDYQTTIHIKKADFFINMVKLDSYDFFSTLRKKLMWGADIRN